MWFINNSIERGDRMQLGVRGHDVGIYEFEPLVSKIHNLGFSCTQLAPKKAIRNFSVENSALTPGMACYMKRILQKEEVDVAVLGCYYNLATPNEDELKRNLATYEAYIRFASILSSGIVGTETGAINEQYAYEEGNHSDEALEIFINNLRPVVAYAESMGVIFGIEPVYKHIVCNVKRAKAVVDAIGSPNLQIILDPVNLLSASNYLLQDIILEEAFSLLKNEIAVIHLKDFVVENGQMKSTAIGKGLVNFKKILQFIKKEKPYIHVLLEETKPENVIESKEFIEQLYNSL